MKGALPLSLNRNLNRLPLEPVFSVFIHEASRATVTFSLPKNWHTSCSIPPKDLQQRKQQVKLTRIVQFANTVLEFKQKVLLRNGLMPRMPYDVTSAETELTLVVVVVVVVAFSSRARILGECSTNHSPPALFFLLKVGISLRTLIPLFTQGLDHSGSAS